MAAVQRFAGASEKPEIRAAMQYFASTGDFPTSVLPLLKTFQLTNAFDMAWQSVFQVVDMTASQRNGFDIVDIEDGLSFNEVPEGDKAHIYKMGGAKESVTFVMYGAGLGWHRQLFDDREYWTIENNAVTFRNKWFYKKSQVAYALIDAISSSYNLAWQAVTPASFANTNENYDAIRDANTISKACETIYLAVADKGYGVNVNSPFQILAPIQLRNRITRALGVLNAGISGAQKAVQWNVSPAYTAMLSSSSVYYVALPGQKTIWAERMPLTVLDKFDVVSYSDIAVGWGRYGGAIGDSAQFQRCAIA